MIDIYELKATYLLTYQVLVPDGGTEPDVKTQNSDPPPMKFDKYSPGQQCSIVATFRGPESADDVWAAEQTSPTHN